MTIALIALTGTTTASAAPGHPATHQTTHSTSHRTGPAVSERKGAVLTRLTGWSLRALTVAPGSRTVFKVRLLSRSGRAGRAVVVQRRALEGGPWTAAARAVTDRHGRARLTWLAPAAEGRSWLRLRAPRHGRALGLVSVPRLAVVDTQAPPPAGGDNTSDDVDPRVAKVLDLVNQARAAGQTCGGTRYAAVPALHLDARLNRAAGGYARRMATEDFFDHVSPDGKDAGDRMTAAGYTWHAWGENIAAGQDTAVDVVRSWLASPGHCANIMSPAFVDLGIGVGVDASSTYGIYWVQNFGHP